uniref:Uncharacterized protein n=1 Tax=Schistosoma japonicum TaxID=6182 RepID=Q5BZU1_SCHJA|nr:unknown [Schistosoma japonicum]
MLQVCIFVYHHPHHLQVVKTSSTLFDRLKILFIPLLVLQDILLSSMLNYRFIFERTLNVLD